MSWWQRALGGEEGAESAPATTESDTQGEKGHTGGVREDLTELTQSFSRGLRGSSAFGLVKGLGSFLAGEPLPGDDEDDFVDGPSEGVQPVEASTREAAREESARFSGETEESAGRQPIEEGRDAETSRKTEEAGDGSVDTEDSAQPVVEHNPPKMKGLKADMSELTGTLSSSISRFSSVIKVVTGEDLLPSHRRRVVLFEKRAEDDTSAKPEESSLSPTKTIPSENPNFGPESASQLELVNKPPANARPADGVQKDFQALTGSIASGFSRLALRFPDMLSLVKRGEDEDEEVDPEAVGVTDEVVAFATSIASHPETWLDFPLSSDETAEELALTELQEDHVYVLEQEAPQIAAMRTELCPAFMSEERFWRVYFVLLASRLGTTGAAQLLTPEILTERKLLLEKLRKERGPLPDDNFETGVPGPAAEQALLHPVKGSPASKETVDTPANKASQAGDRPATKQTDVSAAKAVESEALEREAGDGSAAAGKVGPAQTGPREGADEEDVDDWLDDDGEGGGEQGQSDPHEEDESSFSELEEEEEGASQDVVPVLKPIGTRVADDNRSAGSSSDPARGAGWVQLHRTASQGLKTVSSSSDMEHEETSGEGSPSSPAATSASNHGGSRTNSESGNEWLTVDAEDGRSTVS
ncbi:BSD domain-containing protein [Klebsormidium nitens]|uniref:BSD domain-containing protein n=1 Tax=Klebsormidium nitens TaxID=105231 RepID=A0A1Y1HYA9_KLENI|nr:BSD domain-containing protein [Klebsormidium nitens]|eukprot:GAQ82722.1 BSD domain-containing protein [Klebsormidium nitens]